MATNKELSELLEGRKVDSVRQRGTTLDIDFTDGSTLEVKLLGEHGSIKLTSDDDDTEFTN